MISKIKKIGKIKKKKIVRLSSQRRLILEYLQSAVHFHPTAQQVYQVVRVKLPQISFGTVYRNLNFLEKEGEIKSLIYKKEHVRYDANISSHYHFVCFQCDKVENIILSNFDYLNYEISNRHKLKVDKHSLFFYGTCKDCLQVEQEIKKAKKQNNKITS